MLSSKNDVRLRGERLVELAQRIDFHRQIQGRILRAGGVEGVRDRGTRAAAGEVVVLDEDRVVKADAVVRTAPHAHGVLFDEPPTGSRLARVEDVRRRPPRRAST